MNERLAILRERIRAANVPRARRGESVVVATWNVRELGKSARRKESLRFIAEVIRSFDVCAVIELREDLSDFKGVLRHLGPSFRAIFSECVRDAGGNRERIAFVYDTRLVEFTGMASHLHPPREREGDEYLARVSWWRPPYVASFRSGRLEFVIAAAHIRWGARSTRAKEVGLLADWAQRYVESPYTAVRDVLLIGDFNIPSVNSAAFRALEERGVAVPEALAGVFGTDLAQGKRYDHILAVGHRGTSVHARFTGAGGALDFYAGAHRALYPGLSKRAFTLEMSDHLPLWAEIACG